MKIRGLVRERSPNKPSLLIDRNAKTVELVSHHDATEKTFSALGCVALQLEKGAAVFDRFWPRDMEYNLVDMVQASGLSPASITRLIAAGSLRGSIREPCLKRKRSERGRLFSRVDMYIASVVGSFRRQGVDTPLLVRTGQLLQELLATPANGVEGSTVPATVPAIEAPKPVEAKADPTAVAVPA